MKRYDDLTDEQLIKLAAMAHDQKPTQTIRVDKSNAFYRVVKVEPGVRVVFHCVDGTISRLRGKDYHKVYNNFQITAKCVDWEVYY